MVLKIFLKTSVIKTKELNEKEEKCQPFLIHR